MSLHHAEFNYCPACGTRLDTAEIEGKKRKVCPTCGYIQWGSYSLGVGGVLLDDNKGLIVQRAYNPGKGRWTIPGGYVEQDEKIEDAVVREVWEETGLITAPLSVIGVKDRPQDLPGIKHDIYIVFLLKYLKGKLIPDPGEVSQIGFYTPEECRNFNIAPLSLLVLEKAIEYRNKELSSPGFHKKEGLAITGSLSEFYTLP